MPSAVHNSRIGRDEAELLAINAIGFLAEDPERLGRFLALTGLGPGSLRDAARETAFLASVLDHLLGDEALLLAFSGDAGVKPERIASARRMLGAAGA